MRVRHISLTNFRLYARLESPLPAGPLILVGDNAQGKTSLLEANRTTPPPTGSASTSWR